MISDPLRLADASVVASGLLWGAAYVLILRHAPPGQPPAIPLLATLLNFCWELVFSLVAPGPGLLAYVAGLWLGLDLFLLKRWLRLGPGVSVLPRRLFRPVTFLTMFVVTSGMLLSIAILDDERGRYVAYSQNLVMSLVYFDTRRKYQGPQAELARVAWCRFLGTAFAFSGTVLRGLASPYLWAVAVLITLADLVFIGVTSRGEPGAIACRPRPAVGYWAL